MLSAIAGSRVTLVDVLAWRRAEQPDASNLDDITNCVAAVKHAFKEGHSTKGPPISVRLLSISQPTVDKAIHVLVKTGILAEVGERKRGRLSRYEDYPRPLD